MARLGRGCDQCPSEAIIGFFFQCKNRSCVNYSRPDGEKPEEIHLGEVRLYGRYSNSREMALKFSTIDELKGTTARLNLKFNPKIPNLCYALCLTGDISYIPYPTLHKKDQVKIVDVFSDVLIEYWSYDLYRDMWAKMIGVRKLRR